MNSKLKSTEFHRANLLKLCKICARKLSKAKSYMLNDHHKSIILKIKNRIPIECSDAFPLEYVRAVEQNWIFTGAIKQPNCP